MNAVTDQMTAVPTDLGSGAGVAEPDPDADGLLLDGVVKTYGGARPALDVPRLHVPAGSFTVLVGPSGCGKSTALRVSSGLETPTRGRVLLGGVDVTSTPAAGRGVAMVFQDFALYPHMTVEQNVGFGLRLEARHRPRRGLRGGAGPLNKAEIRRRVTGACELLGLGGLLGRRPAQLSGGERQRVGLARAIVRRPRVLLLDEPLSALDAQLRQQARAELVRLHRELGNTVVMVTHDQLEALAMGTHLIVMNGGRVAQAGPPTDVYHRPADPFVATFVGSPPMNIAPMATTDAGRTFDAPGRRVRLDHPVPGLGASGSSTVLLGWRPGDGVIGGPAEADRPSAPGLAVEATADVVEFAGDAVVVHLTGDGMRAAVTVPARGSWPAVGDRVTVTVPAERLHLFDPADGRRLPAVGA